MALRRYVDAERSLEENQNFIENNPAILSEHALGYMLMKALDFGMEDKFKAMRRVTKQKCALGGGT